MKRINLFLLVLIFSVWSLCAESWFVCAGSFSKYANAEERCSVLKAAGYDCFIGTAEKADGTKLYRVLFLDDAMLRDEARAKKDRLVKSDYFVKKGWTDLWICEAELPAEKAEVPAPKSVLPAAEWKGGATASARPVDESKTEEDPMISCIAQLPLSLDYEVSDMKTCDFVNTKKFPSIYPMEKNFEDFADYDELSVGVYVLYESEDSGAVIECLVIQAVSEFSTDFVEEELELYTDDENSEVVDYEVPHGKMKGYYSEEDGGVYFCGISEDNSLVIFAGSKDITKEKLVDFATASYF